MFAPHLDAEAEAARIESIEAMDLGTVTVVPGALVLVRSLPPQQWGVVTSATRAMAISRLQDAGYPTPSTLVTADDVSLGKPNPEPYMKGAAGLGIAPELCLVFEDAPAGILAAKAAGMRVIAVRTTYPTSQLAGADTTIADFTAIKVVENDQQGLSITLLE